MQSDHSLGRDEAQLGVGHTGFIPLNWNIKATVDKFHGTEREGNLEAVPYETIEREGNILVTVGITAMLNLLSAEASPTAFSNADGYIAVGSNATAAAIGDTTLGTELDRQGMDGVFPTVASNVCTWKSVFATGDSDGAWEEWGILNAAAAGTLLNHKITSFGTKSGGTWTFTVTLTIT